MPVSNGGTKHSKAKNPRKKNKKGGIYTLQIPFFSGDVRAFSGDTNCNPDQHYASPGSVKFQALCLTRLTFRPFADSTHSSTIGKTFTRLKYDSIGFIIVKINK